MELKPLTEPVLRRLTREALVSFLGQAEKFEARFHPDCEMLLSNEPIADLNYVAAGRGAGESRRFAELLRICRSRELPFLAILFPEAGERALQIAAEHGLVHAVDFPFMVRDDQPIEPSGGSDVEIQRVAGSAPLVDCVRVLGTAFGMAEDATLRVLRPAVIASPALEIYLATLGGRPAGSVTVTHHGDTSGIWAMGTDHELQGRGIGRRLLSTVLAESRVRGVRRFFLGATPAGFPLYEKLGFQTRLVTQVWAFGETGQA
jgi:GNAT superfamily N-acetyltransferase